MVVHHRHHGVLHSLLLGGQAFVEVLAQLVSQGLDDKLGVGDLLSVVLDEGKETALGTELVAVVNVLERIRRKELGSEKPGSPRERDVEIRDIFGPAPPFQTNNRGESPMGTILSAQYTIGVMTTVGEK